MSKLPERTPELIANMDRLVKLLDQHGHVYWTSRAREAASLLRDGHRSGLALFLSGFGTNGSFNECVVGKGSWIDGEFVGEPGQRAIHEEFQRLQSGTVALARQLQQESEPPALELFANEFPASKARTMALLVVLTASLFAFAIDGIHR